MSRKTVLRTKLNRHLPESQKMPVYSGPIHQLRGDQPWHIFRQTNSNISHIRIGSVRLGRALRAAKQLARFDRSDYFVAFAKLDHNGAYVVDSMSKRHYTQREHPEMKAYRRRIAEQEAIERKRQEAKERRRHEESERYKQEAAGIVADELIDAFRLVLAEGFTDMASKNKEK